MKKTVVMLLLLVSIFLSAAGTFAQQFYVYENPDDSDETIHIPVDPAHVIGTVRFCVGETQWLPDEINSAICDGDDEAYNAKMAELASNIAQATSAMADAGIPNTLNLWNVYSILKTKECGSGAAATSHADWAREELDRVSFRIGAIDPAIDSVRMCGKFAFGTTLGEYFKGMGVNCEDRTGSKTICENNVIWTCGYDPSFNFNDHWSAGFRSKKP